MKYFYSILLVATVILFTGCDSALGPNTSDSFNKSENVYSSNAISDEHENDSTSILEIAATTDDFSTLATAVQFAGLDEKLDGKRQFTVFAPNNDAFAALLDGLELTAEELFVEENKELVKNILLYHVAPGNRNAEDVTDSKQINTLLKKFISVSETDSSYIVGNDENGYANIITTDIYASNGVIHAIDNVMLPPSNKNNGNGKDDDGDEDDEEEYREDLDTILEIASSDEDFSTLATAVEFAELNRTLDGRKQYTVFAPNNDAFAALLDELELTAEELFVEENKDLVKNILLYHVAPGNRDAEDVTDSEAINTLLKKYIDVQEENGNFFVGNDENGFAQIITTDIFASNGVIHVIDGVMSPPTSDISGYDDDWDDDDEEDDD